MSELTSARHFECVFNKSNAKDRSPPWVCGETCARNAPEQCNSTSIFHFVFVPERYGKKSLNYKLPFANYSLFLTLYRSTPHNMKCKGTLERTWCMYTMRARARVHFAHSLFVCTWHRVRFCIVCKCWLACARLRSSSPSVCVIHSPRGACSANSLCHCTTTASNGIDYREPNALWILIRMHRENRTSQTQQKQKWTEHYKYGNYIIHVNMVWHATHGLANAFIHICPPCQR